MKLENTPENKAKFFALYWGQEVFRHTNPMVNMFVDYHNINPDNNNMKHGFLELTPLSQITDKDYLEVARILYPDLKSFHKIERGKEFVRVFTSTNHREYLYDPIATVKVYKFLLTRGYYVGDGTEIEYGWVKFKEAH